MLAAADTLTLLEPITLSLSHTHTHTQTHTHTKSACVTLQAYWAKIMPLLCLKMSSVPCKHGFSWQNVHKINERVRSRPRQNHWWQTHTTNGMEGPCTGESCTVVQRPCGTCLGWTDCRFTHFTWTWKWAALVCFFNTFVFEEYSSGLFFNALSLWLSMLQTPPSAQKWPLTKHCLWTSDKDNSPQESWHSIPSQVTPNSIYLTATASAPHQLLQRARVLTPATAGQEKRKDMRGEKQASYIMLAC